MGRFASFDLIRFEPGRAGPLPRLARVPADRRALSRVDGLVLGRLLGTGAGDSTARGADLHRWAVFAVWEDREAWEDFGADHPLATRWRHQAVERWSATLAPRRSRGRWSGVEPFADVDLEPSPKDGPVAVLTRATVRIRQLRPFTAATGPVDEVLQETPGLLARVGVGEWPIGQQGTFSLWRDEDAVRAFAWRDATHARIVQRTRDERWYREELFAAFTVTHHNGTWDGRDPLGVAPSGHVVPPGHVAPTGHVAPIAPTTRGSRSRARSRRRSLRSEC